MDENLLNLLFKAMRTGNKNVSGSLGNLDNPLLAYLAGVYDPNVEYTDQQSSQADMPILTKYANDPNTSPFIKDIIVSITNGTDPYQLESMIDSAVTKDPTVLEGTGMSVDVVKKLANEMQKEYSTPAKTSKSKPWWQKAGLPNVLETYNTQTVPLDVKSKELISQLGQQSGDLSKQLAQAQYSERAAREQMRRSATTGEPAMQTPQEKKTAAAAPVQPQMDMQEFALRAGLAGQQPWNYGRLAPVLTALGNPPPPPGVADVAAETIVQAQPKYQKKKSVDVTGQAYKDLQARAIERGYIQKAMANKQREEQAVREGVLKAYEMLGKTPTGDALATMMQFIAKSK